MDSNPVKHVKVLESIKGGNDLETEFGTVAGAIAHLEEEREADAGEVVGVVVIATRESGAVDDKQTFTTQADAVEYLHSLEGGEKEADAKKEEETAPAPKEGDACTTDDGKAGTLSTVDGALVCVATPVAGDTCKLEDGTDGVLTDVDGALVCQSKPAE